MNPIPAVSDITSGPNASGSSSTVRPQYRTAEYTSTENVAPTTGHVFLPESGENVGWVQKIDSGFWRRLEGHKAQDMSPVNAWKDELSNLLIFIGIFSSVLTGFIVISIPLLQENPTVFPTQLPFNISLALPSSLDASSTLNISAQSNSTTLQFDTSDQIVQINILWTCSLSLCLTTAFYTISAQQWLRHLTVPPNLVPRETVLLRELYTTSLSSWNVEDLINMLPMLIQVAVILFLGGMAVFLKLFNTVVFTIFLAVSFTPLIIWLVLSIIPFINLRCPYKSPAMLAALLLLRMAIIPILSILYIVSIIIAELICKSCVSVLQLLRASEKRKQTVKAAFRTFARGPINRLISTQFGEMVLQWTRFRHWTSCELGFINREENSETLAFSAISSALQKLSPGQSRQLFRDSLEHIPPALYLKFTLDHYLQTHFERHHRKIFTSLFRKDNMLFMGNYSLDHDILYKVSEELWLCLTEYLDRNNTNSGAIPEYCPSVQRDMKEIAELTCLIHRATLSLNFDPHPSVAERAPFSMRKFVDRLVQMQASLLEHIIRCSYARVPTSLIFFYCDKYGYHGSISLCESMYEAHFLFEELTNALKSPNTKELLRAQARASMENIHPYESVLCATATALIALRCNGESPLTESEKLALTRITQLFCPEELFTAEFCEDVLHLISHIAQYTECGDKSHMLMASRAISSLNISLKDASVRTRFMEANLNIEQFIRSTQYFWDRVEALASAPATSTSSCSNLQSSSSLSV